MNGIDVALKCTDSVAEFMKEVNISKYFYILARV